MFGTFESKVRNAALIITILCLVVAAAASQAQNVQAQSPASTCLKFGSIGVCPTFTTATFMTTTKVKTMMTVSTGTDKSVLASTPDNRYRIKHNITVRGLAPNTNYVALVTATPKKGKATRQWISFQTAAPGSSPATVTTRGNKLLLNGQPFFPWMILSYNNPCPDPETVNAAASVGAVFDSTDPYAVSCASNSAQWSQSLHEELNKKLWWHESDSSSFQELSSQNLPELLGWQGEIKLLAGPSPQVFENPCFFATKLFEAVKSASRSQPVMSSVSLAQYPIVPNRDTCTTPQDLGMLFWSSVAAGAKAFEVSMKDQISQHDLNPALQAQAVILKSQMASLGPAILTGKSTAATSSENTVKIGAWTYGGYVFIVAVNTTDTPTSANITVQNLAGSSGVNVLWENRSLKVATSGAIQDQFGSRAVHIYRTALPKAKKHKK